MKRISRLRQWYNRLTGDWWGLETDGELWGVCHPVRTHLWQNFIWSREQAEDEQRMRNEYPAYDWKGEWIDPRIKP